VRGREWQPGSHHSTADINADSCWHDRALGRNDRADRRAHSPMNIGHDGDMLKDEGQRGDIPQLLAGLVFNRNTTRPCLNRDAAHLQHFQAGRLSVCWIISLHDL